MAMMENIRRSTDSVWMKLVFGIIVLVFVFWGIGATGPTNTEVATVNGSRITDTELHQRMRSIPTGGAQDDDQLRALQQEVIQQLIREEVLNQEAERLGLEVSPTEIALYLWQYSEYPGGPATFVTEGTFDDSLYEQWLESQGMKRSVFEEQLRKQILRQKLFYLAQSSVVVSDVQVWQAYNEGAPDSVQVPIDLPAGPNGPDGNPVTQTVPFPFLGSKKIGYSVIEVTEMDVERSMTEPSPEAIDEWVTLNAETVDTAFQNQQITFRRQLARCMMRPALSECEIYERPSDKNAIEEAASPTLDELTPPTTDELDAYMAENDGAISTRFETERETIRRNLGQNLMQEATLSDRTKEVADLLLDSWKQGDEALEAQIGELSEGAYLSVLEMPLNFVGAPPTGAEHYESPYQRTDALKAFEAVGQVTGLFSELALMESTGTPELKQSDEGWVLVRLDEIETPSREAFDALSDTDAQLVMGYQPLTGEPILWSKDQLRIRVWGQEASLFADAWVRDLVTRADVQQLFVP